MTNPGELSAPIIDNFPDFVVRNYEFSDLEEYLTREEEEGYNPEGITTLAERVSCSVREDVRKILSALKGNVLDTKLEEALRQFVSEHPEGANVGCSHNISDKLAEYLADELYGELDLPVVADQLSKYFLPEGLTSDEERLDNLRATIETLAKDGARVGISDPLLCLMSEEGDPYGEIKARVRISNLLGKSLKALSETEKEAVIGYAKRRTAMQEDKWWLRETKRLLDYLEEAISAINKCGIDGLRQLEHEFESLS